MSDSGCATAEEKPYALTVVAPSRRQRSMGEDVRDGLSERPRELSPKYFYDQRGSLLFDRICDTPEYYPTRTEAGLLDRHAGEIVRMTQPRSILELGSGTSRKTRTLLDHWRPVERGTYWPFDVSAEMLEEVAEQLADEYPHLGVHALVGDYTGGFGNFPDLDGRTLALFLGSTLGNFAPEFAAHFLAEFATHLDQGDYFLLGTDLDKDPAVLEAAYNDAQGITAQFNLNMLRVLNRELDADFAEEAFAHRAVYNRRLRRVEMYLDSRTEQVVRIRRLGLVLKFAEGEPMLTEISRKFTVAELDRMLAAARLKVVETFVDDAFPYALTLARK
ncbi:MAG: L-histidine N(alpha)-methyltransferase [Xanthomonadales bacterium]|nr:L-histidine N(alpha)-methyltransferase [Xanthomonadales bacterium]